MANHMVNKKQQTVCWHVDDLKLSHVHAGTNDDFIKAFKSEYESIFEDGSGKMKVSQGKVQVPWHDPRLQCQRSMQDNYAGLH
jgi:ribosomal protein S11